MDGFLNVAVIAALAFVAVFAFRFIALFVMILRMPFWGVKYTPIAWEPALAPDQQAAVNELRGFGFEQVATHRLNMGPLGCESLCFEHENGRAFASLTFLSGAAHDFMVEFFSFAADGRLLLTINRSGWLLAEAHIDAEVADALADSLEEHWKFHRERIRSEALASVDAKVAVARQIEASEGSLPRRIAAKAVVQGRDGAWHYTFRSAVRTVLGWWKVRAKLAKPYRSAVSDGPHRSGLFARIYEQIETINAAKPARPNVTVGVLILTAAVSVALWGKFFDWQFAMILLAVILVHEGGHALAMRASGYRDISMFFIPMIGAAVTGHPKEMPVWKQAIVLLAGPLPGLLAATAFLVWRGFFPFETPYFDFGQATIIALTVNLFNMLPITPLDGGQLLEISVFSRWPRARLAFSALSVLAFGLLAAWLENPYLGLVTAVLILSLFYKWRITDLHRAWKEGLPPHEQLVHLFGEARRAFGPQTFLRHYRLVKAVFTQRKILKARVWESALALGVMALVWAPIGVAAVELWPQKKARKVEAAAPKPDPRTGAQREFDTAFNQSRWQEAPTGFARLDALAGELESSDPRRADLAFWHVLALPAKERAPRLEALVAAPWKGLLFGRGDAAAGFLHTAMEGNAAKPASDRIAALQAGLSRIATLWPGNGHVTYYYRIRLAEMIGESGDAAGAMSALEAARAALVEAKAGPVYVASIVRALAWYSITREQPEQARQLLENTMPEGQEMRRQLEADYAWALLFSGEVKAGLKRMRAAAYTSPPIPGFMDNALGIRIKPRLHMPLELAYAMIKNKKSEEAAALIAKEAPSACRGEPSPWNGPWFEARNRAIRAAYAAVCPALAKSADAGK